MCIRMSLLKYTTRLRNVMLVVGSIPVVAVLGCLHQVGASVAAVAVSDSVVAVSDSVVPVLILTPRHVGIVGHITLVRCGSMTTYVALQIHTGLLWIHGIKVALTGVIMSRQVPFFVRETLVHGTRHPQHPQHRQRHPAMQFRGEPMKDDQAFTKTALCLSKEFCTLCRSNNLFRERCIEKFDWDGTCPHGYTADNLPRRAASPGVVVQDIGGCCQGGCRNCEHLKDEKCAAPRGRASDSPIRLCINAIAHKWAASLTGRVLELGYGTNRMFRTLITRKRGVEWVGVDPRYDDGASTDIPYPDASFDAVVLIQCLEHWQELGCGLAEGLAEILRVLKPGGQLLFNVPMFSHGHELFVTGDVAGILDLFDDSWELESTAEWRKHYEPLEPHVAWRRRALEQIKRHYAAAGQAEPSAWVFEAVFRKKAAAASMPGLGKLAANFSGAVKRAAAATIKGDEVLVNSLTKDSRLAICNMCEMRVGSRCSHPDCGCFLAAKTKFATEECPLGLW